MYFKNKIQEQLDISLKNGNKNAKELSGIIKNI
jgi:hypothetical protein